MCRKENACCHQGIADVTWHINTKGHKAKQKALQSSCEIEQYSLPLPSAGAMTPQEMMVGSAVMFMYWRDGRWIHRHRFWIKVCLLVASKFIM